MELLNSGPYSREMAIYTAKAFNDDSNGVARRKSFNSLRVKIKELGPCCVTRPAIFSNRILRKSAMAKWELGNRVALHHSPPFITLIELEVSPVRHLLPDQRLGR